MLGFQIKRYRLIVLEVFGRVCINGVEQIICFRGVMAVNSL